MRPCGKLDTYEAVGMTVGDLLGLPLIPARPYALAIGKKFQKLEASIAAELKKVAKRKGDVEAAQAVVLRKVVTLDIPTRAEYVAAARDLARASSTSAPAPPPTVAPPPEPFHLRWWKAHGFADEKSLLEWNVESHVSDSHLLRSPMVAPANW